MERPMRRGSPTTVGTRDDLATAVIGGPEQAHTPELGESFRVWLARPEAVRLLLVGATLLIFLLTLLGAFVTIMWGPPEGWTNYQALLEVVLPIESLIIGGAVTYFFAAGSKTAHPERKE